MASCGRHLNIWSKRWGNTDATGTSSGYQNISGDQLRLTTGQSYTYYDCPGSTINFTTTVANGVYLLRADLQTYACLLYTSPSPRDSCASRMPSSA